MTISFTVTNNPNQNDTHILHDLLSRHNLHYIEGYKKQDILCLAKDSGTIIGGASGWVQFGLLFIDTLFVEEKFRRQGFGKQLTSVLEEHSMSLGAIGSHLTTSSFQNPDFYISMGYSQTDKFLMLGDNGVEFYCYNFRKYYNI